MLTLTPTAAEQIRNAATAQQDEDDLPPYLRVAAKIEDDEIVYGMGFDEVRENDQVIEAHGVTLLIAPRSQELLVETTLDFVELRPGEFQFVFINPRDPESCGGQTTNACTSCGSANPNGGCRR